MNESDSYAQKRLMAVGDIEVVDLAAFLIWILGGKSVLENLDLELSRQSASRSKFDWKFLRFDRVCL